MIIGKNCVSYIIYCTCIIPFIVVGWYSQWYPKRSGNTWLKWYLTWTTRWYVSTGCNLFAVEVYDLLMFSDRWILNLYCVDSTW